MPVTTACPAARAEVENRWDLTLSLYLSWSGKIPVGLVGLAGLLLDKRTTKTV